MNEEAFFRSSFRIPHSSFLLSAPLCASAVNLPRTPSKIKSSH
jgi:hypothetical protein